ncbi:MAG: fatty acid desaturase, partial [Gammaproteobacteria bacterium]|nr:fatty acid desaturase [Gammaproteobacteria bacterium]
MNEGSLKLDEDSAEPSEGLRIGRDLINATVPFAEESVKVSWWHVGSTFAMLTAALAGAGLAPWWPLRLLFSLLAAMLMVRTFITYHDYMHRAILVRSRLAWILFRVYSALALTPPRSWKKSHNYHHGHVGQVSSSSIGSFPIMTTRMWHEATRATRSSYRIVRHPLTVLTGYITVFFFSITLLPLLRNPARH